MKSYAKYLEQLDDVRKTESSALEQKYRLICATGEWLDSAVLKLQKKEWSDGGPGQGVFFSIWLGEKDVKKGCFHYNIHALKLRLREGYEIKSIEFAEAFREKFESSKKQWPNVSTEHGPQTLMQGWLPLNQASFRRDVLDLMKNFVRIHKAIDLLLEERKISS